MDVNSFNLKVEDRAIDFLPSDMTERFTEHWIKNRVWAFMWLGIYRKNFLTENKVFIANNLHAEDRLILFEAMFFAKKFLIMHDAVYIYRVRTNSLSHPTGGLSCSETLKSMIFFTNRMGNIMNKFPPFADNRILRDMIVAKMMESLINNNGYNGSNIPIELDKAVYETLLPMFGENTTIVKHLFHGYNNMWRQAQIFAEQRNYLAQQNHLLQQKLDALTAQQKNLNNQLEEILKNFLDR